MFCVIAAHQAERSKIFNEWLTKIEGWPRAAERTSSDCWAHQSGAFEAIVLSDIDRWAKGKFLANSDQR